MKQLDLGKEKISKLLLSFSIPCVISMLINSIYNIVDQIFIGKGVGTLGNAATNVIFPLVIICNAVAGLIGNGTAANLSLKLGEGKKDEASKSIGQSITIMVILSILLSVLAFIFLPKLVYLFGCTDTVYNYAITYGKIILIGAPFMICYTAISSIIRADGSPKYSMNLLVIGAIINIILDPIFIFKFNLGVAGGAYATIIGQFISFIIAILYIPKIKSVNLSKKDFKLDKNVFKILGLGLSSFITQGTVLALFIFMNNIMTKYGALTKYGSDIPLSVYGVVSKLNNLFVSTVLGISIGSQPIIGFNYGAGNYDRVKQTLKYVLTINFIVGIVFNLIFFIFPEKVVGIFISKNDPNYALFIEFGKLTFHSFLAVCSLNALEMTTSIVIQSIGKVVKATMVSFARQIILFIPIASILCIVLNKGIYGALISGPIADIICFIFCIFLFKGEYDNIGKNKEITTLDKVTQKINTDEKIVITIAREYGSGGRYVGKLLAQKLDIPFYDKELINEVSQSSGLSKEYIEKNEQRHRSLESSMYNNDNNLFIEETKVIKKLAKNSCVIVGRCSNYILKDNKNVFNIFLYSDMNSKIKRAVKYYNIKENKAEKIINKINKDREKHYKYYTNTSWKDFNNYDLILNVDKFGVEKTSELIYEIIKGK